MNERLPIVLNLLSLTSLTSATFDYCSINCDIPYALHTMCKYPDDISEFCESFELQTDDSKANLIDLHNSYRNDYAFMNQASNMMFVTWDNELEEIATRWIKQCNDEEEDVCRDVERFKVSQNVGFIQFPYAKKRAIHHDAVFHQWTYEQVFCAPPNMRRWDTSHEQLCSHFTNIIWANVTHFGCADAVNLINSTIEQRSLVCNYGPAGNRQDESVFLSGPPCSQCPNGTKCYPTSRFPYLCAADAEPKIRVIQERGTASQLAPLNAFLNFIFMII